MKKSNWDSASYDIIDTVSDKYYFAGSAWNTQVAKRFILNVRRFDKVIESSYYLHLQENGTPFNVAFEPSTSFGCAVGCLFCASGTLSPIKTLNAEEMAEQVQELISVYKSDFPSFSNVRKDVFYSGIGEPTLIIDTIIEASQKILKMHPDLQFKISTMGAVPKSLVKLAQSKVPLRSLQIGIPHWNEEKIKYLYAKAPGYNLIKLLESIKEFMFLRPETAIK